VVGTRTFAYNGPNDDGTLQLATETIDGSGSGLYSKTITRDYEDNTGVTGRAAGFHINTEYDLDYGYDAKGRLDEVTGPALPGSGTATYTREPDSEMIDRLKFGSDDHAVVYGLHADADVVTSVTNTMNTTMRSTYTYAYDALWRRESVVNAGPAFPSQPEFNIWQYNDRSELGDSKRYAGSDPEVDPLPTPITGQDFVYAYDLIGNRTSYTLDGGTPTNYTRNTLNQYTATDVPAETFTYDEDGNMTADGTWVYTWNAENQLYAVTKPNPVNGDKGVQFDYDYLGRRVRKLVYTHNGTGYTLTSDQRFVYDGWNVVLVLDGLNSNATTQKYTWGLDLSGSIHGAGGVGGLLACEDGSDDYVYLYDANGNVGQVIDAGDYSVAAHYEYDPYGNQIVATGSYAADNPFRFSTKWYDAVTGLSYYGFRYYSPRIGRWLNRDPIGEYGGLNLYGFLENDPVDVIDLNGLWTIERNGGDRALATPGPNDTVAGLALILRLNVREYKLWLKSTPGGPPVPDSPYLPIENDCANCPYTIPNRVILIWGELKKWEIWNQQFSIWNEYRRIIVPKIRFYRQEAFRVIESKEPTAKRTIELLKGQDDYIFIYAGHTTGAGSLTPRLNAIDNVPENQYRSLAKGRHKYALMMVLGCGTADLSKLQTELRRPNVLLERTEFWPTCRPLISPPSWLAVSARC
jgi:RHS repeat-associated protein